MEKNKNENKNIPFILNYFDNLNNLKHKIVNLDNTGKLVFSEPI